MPLSQTEMIEYLRRIKNLKRTNGFLDLQRTEADFLAYSAIVGRGKLTVKLPNSYVIEGEDANKFGEAIKESGIDLPVPSEIGMSGGFEGVSNDRIFILSPNQYNRDDPTHSRVYLNPLLLKIFGENAKLVRDFTLHEALYGRVRCLAGELDLSEIGLFPEKFKPGAYTLSVELDTPKQSIKSFMELERMLAEFEKDPEACLKTEEKVIAVTSKALELRSRMNSLSRYEIPKTNIFSEQVNSCLLENGKNSSFYLYNPEQKKNVLVYFGEYPIKNKNAPLDLTVLNGADKQTVLANLLGFDFYKVSSATLTQKLETLNRITESAARIRGKADEDEHYNLKKLLERLNADKRILDQMISAESQKNFALGQPAEILEFMVCPTTSDPVVHDLLSHLSWNNSLRVYHNTPEFKESFTKADAKARASMLGEIIGGLNFTNQQNNDINVWLYNNYKDFCISKGVEFSLTKKATN